MEITFLGTSSGVPTRFRNVSSVALKLPQRGEVWLFDCGEGTQHQLLRSDVKISQITRIFVTHMHGDHIYGLTGLLASSGLAGSGQPMEIYGPPELKDYLHGCAKYSHFKLASHIRVYPIHPGILYEDKEFEVSCRPLKHRIPAYGYRIAEKDRPGRFNVEKAKALNIPPGPVYGELKQGKTVTLEDGRRIRGQDLCGERESGRKVIYCTDTVFCEEAIALSEDADVLIHEATFAHQDAQLAFERLHSTSTMAAQVALAAQVKQLIMTHFSPRYAPGNNLQLDDLLYEAKAIFPNTILARDFLTYEVPRRASHSKN
ncbi:ribonuclease Z [Crocosphaera sp. Alani8]|uniref:ribonuclease Z n=1 Tax=Crocosphaera sp. Alani8 TaxID=3038952 RepID=UPI00313B2111